MSRGYDRIQFRPPGRKSVLTQVEYFLRRAVIIKSFNICFFEIMWKSITIELTAQKLEQEKRVQSLLKSDTFTFAFMPLICTHSFCFWLQVKISALSGILSKTVLSFKKNGEKKGNIHLFFSRFYSGSHIINKQ